VEAQLATLHSVLLAPNGPKLIAIEGIGGIGKTALAHKLVRHLAQHEQAFADFGWISAQKRFLEATGGIRSADAPALTVQALIEALVTQLIAGAAGGAPVAPDRALLALENRLREAPHLIVVDNLETVADVESLLPTLLRLASPSKFLLTSRETCQGPAGIYHFAVPELSETDALDLVRHEARLQGMTHVAGVSADELCPIYATVGGNPLALRLVTGQLQILTLRQVLENLRAAARSQVTLGILLHSQGQTEQALTIHRKVEPLFRRLGDRPWLARVLNNQGVFLSTLGRPTEAALAYEEAAGLHLGNADPALAASSLLNWAELLLDLGQEAQARPPLERAGQLLAALPAPPAWVMRTYETLNGRLFTSAPPADRAAW